MTPEEIREARQAIEWKANLYAMAAEILADADAGDPLALRIVASVGLAAPLHLVKSESAE